MSEADRHREKMAKRKAVQDAEVASKTNINRVCFHPGLPCRKRQRQQMTIRSRVWSKR